jgi:hypothetical protein
VKSLIENVQKIESNNTGGTMGERPSSQFSGEAVYSRGIGLGLASVPEAVCGFYLS